MSRSIFNATYRLFLRFLKGTGLVGDLVVANVTGEQDAGAVAGTVSVTGPDGKDCLNERFELPALSPESYRTYSDVFGRFGEYTITVDVEEPVEGGSDLGDKSVADVDDGESRVGNAPLAYSMRAGGRSPAGIVCVLVRHVGGGLHVDFDVVPDPNVAADRFEAT